MTGTLVIPLPAFLARYVPAAGWCIGGISISPLSWQQTMREHELTARLARVFGKTLRQLAPLTYQRVRDQAIADMEEAGRMIANSEMPGVMPLHEALGRNNNTGD